MRNPNTEQRPHEAALPASFSRYLREAADPVGTLPVVVDWPALAVAIGAPAVGIAGVVFGYMQSRGERNNARELVDVQYEHSRQSARGERLYDARSEAYRHLLRQLHRVMMIIERTEPMIGPTSPAPERPSDDEWTEMYVSIAMFGSPELNEAFRDFGAKWAAFQVHASRWSRARQGQSDETGAGMEMHNARQEAADTLRKIEQMVRDELAAL